MKRRTVIKHTALASAAMLFAGLPFVKSYGMEKSNVKFRLLRHAALLIDIAGKKILVDPMLGKKDSMDPIANAANSIRIPMTELPVSGDELAKILSGTDAVLLTHLHRDHWDAAAQQMIPKDKLIFCQAGDEAKISEQGFVHVQPIETLFDWEGISIHRTDGQHGTGEIGKKMGHVSGYVLAYKQEKLYIAGDTIWCNDVANAITQHRPDHIVINGGGAQFLQGDPITMTTTDMLALATFTDAKITVVHLETINHCLQRRPDFRKAVEENKLSHRVQIPNDGDWVSL